VDNQRGNDLVFWTAIIAAAVVFINIIIHGWQKKCFSICFKKIGYEK
jgi:hypothetical protein